MAKKKVEVPSPVYGETNCSYYVTVEYKDKSQLEWLKNGASLANLKFGVFPKASSFVFFACNDPDGDPKAVAGLIQLFLKEFKRKEILYVVYTDIYYPISDDGCVNGGAIKVTARGKKYVDLIDWVERN